MYISGARKESSDVAPSGKKEVSAPSPRIVVTVPRQLEISPPPPPPVAWSRQEHTYPSAPRPLFLQLLNLHPAHLLRQWIVHRLPVCPHGLVPALGVLALQLVVAAGLQFGFSVTPEDVAGDFGGAHQTQACRGGVEDVERQVVGAVDQRVRGEGTKLAQRDGGVGEDADDAGGIGGETDEHMGAGEDALTGGGGHCGWWWRWLREGGGGGGSCVVGGEKIGAGVQNFVCSGRQEIGPVQRSGARQVPGPGCAERPGGPAQAGPRWMMGASSICTLEMYIYTLRFQDEASAQVLWVSCSGNL